MRIRRIHIIVSLLAGAAFPLPAQFDPQGAQVLSYFPQLADGGSSAQQWQTAFDFVNPNTQSSALGVVELFGDDGSPLKLDFGSGPVSTFNFTLAPLGSATFRTAGTSPSVSIGWALAASSLPLEGVVRYHYSVNGVPQQGVSAQATPPSLIFRSPATASTGIAVVNIYDNVSIPVKISALNTAGTSVATTQMTLGPGAHRAFSLTALFPGLPSSFQGTVALGTSAGFEFVAWTLSGDAGVLSSYPPSGLGWPVSHYEQIWRVWFKLLNAATQLTPLNPVPNLVIDYTTGAINSFAVPARNEVDIFMNLAELISDSDSELAFVVGHELGHIIQARINSLQFVPSNIEQDADEYGVYLGMLAGYDPYAGAGALAKLAMASGDAGLVSQLFDNLSTDPHGSFNTRLALIFSYMQSVCAMPEASAACAEYKSLVHPHLPANAPLTAGPPKPVGVITAPAR